MTRVLVTGARGVVGRWVVEELLRRGDDVHAVGRASGDAIPLGVTWHSADLLDARARERLLHRRFDELVHLAWETTHGGFWTSPANHAWFLATLDLVRRFRCEGGGRVLAAGTCAEYDWRATETDCVEFLTRTRPTTPYGAAKLATLEALSAEPDAEEWLAWARLFSPYGPGEAVGRLVPSVVNAVLDGRPCRIRNGRVVRDYLYAPAVATAIVALLRSPTAGPVNVASGEPVTLTQVAVTIAELVGRPELIEVDAQSPGPGEPLRLVADLRRLRDEVRHAPLVDLASGLAHTVAWWRRIRGDAS